MTGLSPMGGGAGRHVVHAAGRQGHVVGGGAMVEHLVERKTEQTKVEVAAKGAAAVPAGRRAGVPLQGNPVPN